MALSRDELKQFLQQPRETLHTELKEWIDPQSDEGKAKIARACIALFNNDGGFLVIGFTNSGNPANGPPEDVRKKYHPDVLQSIVAKYASQPIAIEVEFVDHDGVEYPVIHVPSGIVTPCAAKAGIRIEAAREKWLIKENTIYVRTISSNNTVSSAEPRIPDWELLVARCHDNRDANIGAFLRRHLVGANVDALRSIIAPPPPAPSLKERCNELLDECRKRFDRQMKSRMWPNPFTGFFEVAVIIDGEVPEHRVDDEFYRTFETSKPRHSGWPFWVDAKGGRDSSLNAYVLDGGWEALLSTKFLGHMLDYWRAEPAGRFYHLRNLQDDSHEPEVQSNRYLDYALHTGRVAEVVSIMSHVARALGCNPASTVLGIATRWSGLAGRDLYSWSNKSRVFHSYAPAVQDEILTYASMPLDSVAFGPVVEELVAPVFSLFGGWRFDSRVIEGIVKDVLDRRY